MPSINSLKGSVTPEHLYEVYKGTQAYIVLAKVTKVSYDKAFKIVLPLIPCKTIKGVKPRMCKVIYEELLARGVTTANYCMKILSMLFNFAVEYEAIPSNPWRFVRKVKPKPRKVVWTQADLDKFLTSAYSDFKWRNVGIITQMCYAWCQRVVDMRRMKWDQLDFDKNTIYIEQTKRSAEVFLPLQDDIKAVLLEQREDFGFQEYVAPNIRPVRGVHKCYDTAQVSRIANEIKADAGINMDLRISDLRRTGVTEMIDAGVDVLHIQQVTGHANPASVQPYMKNTLKAATHALDMRRNDNG